MISEEKIFVSQGRISTFHKVGYPEESCIPRLDMTGSTVGKYRAIKQGKDLYLQLYAS